MSYFLYYGAYLLPMLVLSVVVLLNFQKYPKTLKFLGILILFSFSLDLINVVLAFFRINNYPFHYLWTLVEIICMHLIYYHLIESKTFRSFIKVNGLLFVSIWIFSSFISTSFNGFSYNIQAIFSLFYIIYSLYFFFQLFNNPVTVNLKDYPYFWMNSGFLIYFSGTIFLFLFEMQIVEETGKSMWIVHNIVATLKNLALILTLWKASKSQ